MPVARPPLHGIESIFSKAAMARSGSPRRADIRARMSMDCGLLAASCSMGCKAMARVGFSPGVPQPGQESRRPRCVSPDLIDGYGAAIRSCSSGASRLNSTTLNV